MATKEIQSTIEWSQNEEVKEDILSKVNWIFTNLKSKFNKKESKTSEISEYRRRVFNLNRKDGVITLIIAICLLGWVVFYGWLVVDGYSQLNDKSWELKELKTYNITPDVSTLSAYANWRDMNKVDWMIAIYDDIQETIDQREIFQQQQKSYYGVLLQNLYLPSLNVWKDPYTKNFDMSIIWQKYLETDKSQDLYLIQYWSDFIKYVWNDADYNTVESISIWDKEEMEWTDFFYTPISITFKSPNKRSFLLLVNKLSMTSNSNNIALINEFFFYLLEAIKEKKTKEINSLMREYRPAFSSSSNRTGPSDLKNLTEDEVTNYQDQVIWYNLYQWINYSWTGKNTNPLIDDALIAMAVKKNANCDPAISDAECFYNFRDKYRNIPYLAYTVWLEKQENRTLWLLNFLQDLPSIITITDFWFEKFSNSSFLNNEQEQYEWNVSFYSYWRNITQDDLNETASSLWKLCFGSASEQVISPDVALTRINNTIASLWWDDKNRNVSSLWELQWIFTNIVSEYDGLSNYNKMVKLFEIWRMMNDANLCNI